MKVTEELIHKFFRQECTPEEHSAVSEYFHLYPDEVDRYMDIVEWQNFNSYSKLHPAISQKMLDVVEQHICKKTPRNNTSFKTIAIAASLVTTIGIALMISLNVYKDQQIKTAQATTKHHPLQQQYNDTVSNKTEKTMLVSLEDGSTVLLSGKSEIMYRHPFIKKQRDIYLKGEGIFSVAKDKTRPFTVHAGGLATTALGTRFKVTAFEESKNTAVRLYTGKVVIRQQKNMHNAGSNVIYLTPGHLLILDKENHTTHVSGFAGNKSNAIRAEKGTTTINNGMITFQNQSLSEVIKVLEQTYHINIQTDQAGLSNRYFTGLVNHASDSPEDVLRTIATLNKFRLNKKSGVYILSR